MQMKHVMEILKYADEMNLDFEDVEVDENTICFNGAEYIVLDEDEVNERLNDHLQETASYFNYSFLADMTDLPEEVFKGLIDKNEAVYRLIEKTCGVEEFIEEMIKHDGVGHFLSSYDGNEIELSDGLLAFRVG